MDKLEDATIEAIEAVKEVYDAGDGFGISDVRAALLRVREEIDGLLGDL